MNKLQIPRGYRNAEKLHNRYHAESEGLWILRGKRRAFRLFHEMAARVPAYKDFLKSKKFSVSSVKTEGDFIRIPVIDKTNYLRKYSKEMLCWDGEFARSQWVISTTSGSTGEPYYFPREQSQDWQYSLMAELYFRNNFKIQHRTTLYIIAFPMGAWIGGLFTYEAAKIMAGRRGYDLSIITPGINKQEVINAVKQLGQYFDQVIIGSYAPFLKDILDDGAKQGVEWSKFNMGFIFSAEAFTETFRDFVANKTGIKSLAKQTLNHYGTVDLGTMAYETPEAICIRRLLVDERKLNVLFPEEFRQPTLCQYDPSLFYFEEVGGALICSAYSGIPLVRYDLHDYGGVLSRSTIYNRLQERLGINIADCLANENIEKNTWNLPFVYVYERNDFSVSYYAFQIYPDTVRRALQTNELEMNFTGKFTMYVDYDHKGRQKLCINIEAKDGVISNTALTQTLEDSIDKALMNESSEYREVMRLVGAEARPVVTIWPYGHTTYFKPGVKQQWVKRS